jgi:feruloyl esterase
MEIVTESKRLRARHVLLGAALFCPLALTAATNCGDLASLALPNMTVTSATEIAAGEFTPPTPGRGPNAANAFKKVPAFCRIMARLKPTSDSDIKIEVWMPASGWNGKLESVGNGGFAGSIGYPALGTAVSLGYAAASTDTGHEGGAGDFVVGHPERLIDFAYRAVHEMTVASKGIIAAYYNSAPKYSYWSGCSTGGRQAMTEAQRYPADYDGIVAGAAASYATRLHATQITISQATHKDEASYIPPEKYPLIHNAVLEKCDALDGVKDGVLEDPTRCRFDPGVLECKDGVDNASCLTKPQVKLARTVYAGLVSGSGDHLFPGLEPGSELGWNSLSGPRPMTLAIDMYRLFAFNDSKWNYLDFNVDTDLPKAEKLMGATMNSVDPNLKPFFSHGGKLLQYHGWSDNGIPAESSVNYYKSVLEFMGGVASVKDNYRLFMVPGMFHCGGGDGTSTFDMLTALDQWVVNKKAPEQIAASRVKNGVVDRTRPLCPYPQVAVYKGSGSIDEAANFSCKFPSN